MIKARQQDDPGGHQRHRAANHHPVRASFGAGNYGMCGRGFARASCSAGPTATTAVMGGEQAAGTMRIVTEAALKRKGIEPDAVAKMQKQFDAVSPCSSAR